MKLALLDVENFFTLKAVTLDLSKPGCVVVAGENHDAGGPSDSNAAGKSVLAAEALAFALTGATLRKATREAVCLHGPCKMTLTGETNAGRPFVLQRRVSAGQHMAEFEVDGETVYQVKPVERAVKEALGVDLDTLSALMIVGQDSLEFAAAVTSDAQRKSLLEAVCGLEDFSGAQNAAKARLWKLQDKLEALSRGGQGLEGEMRVSKQAWEDAKVLRDGLVGKQMETMDELEVTLRGHEEAVAVADAGIEESDEAMSALELTADGLRDELNDSSHNATKADGDVRLKIQEHVTAIAQYQKRLDLIASGACPTCERDFKGGGFDVERSKLSEHVLAAGGIIKKLEGKWEAKMDALDKEADLLNEGIKRAKAEVGEMADRRRGFEAEAKDERDLVEHTKRQMDSVHAHGERIKDAKGAVKKAADAIAATINSLSLVDTQVKMLQARIPVYEFWVEGFSDRGIRSYMLDALSGTISNMAGSYYARLALQDCEVRMSAVERLKGGGTRERVSLEVRKGEHWQLYRELNVGDRALVDLSLVCALQDLGELRGMVRYPVVVFDEVFANLGPAKAAAVAEFLAARAVEKEQLFLVPTNDVALRGKVPEEIMVVLSGGVSSVSGSRVVEE